MQGFDLSDTLVRVNYESGNVPQAIRDASVIYRPLENFVIITAQQQNAATNAAVRDMVRINFPICQHVYIISGGRAEIIQKKAEIIKRLALSDFTDNNEEILAGIKELNTGATLHIMTADGPKPY